MFRNITASFGHCEPSSYEEQLGAADIIWLWDRHGKDVQSSTAPVCRWSLRGIVKFASIALQPIIHYDFDQIASPAFTARPGRVRRMRVNFRLSAGFVSAVFVCEGLSVFAVSLGIIVTLQVLGGAYAN